MAHYIIFDKDGGMVGLAKTESLRDHFVNHYENAQAREITEDKWVSASQDTITLMLVNGNIDELPNQIYDSNREGETDEQKNQRWIDTFNAEVANQIQLCEDYLSGITDADWQSYLDNLKSVDVASVTFPIDSFQKWFNSQSGFSQKSIWELP